MNDDSSLPFGGWLELESMHVLELGYELSIIYPSKHRDKIISYNQGIRYIPLEVSRVDFFGLKSKKSFKKIFSLIQPDLVHIHGTEYARAYRAYQSAFESNINTVVTIQGLISEVYKNYLSGIDVVSIIKYRFFSTLKLKHNYLFKLISIKKNSYFEKKIIKKINNIIGRTNWDFYKTISIQKNRTYHHVNRVLRAQFYSARKWDFNLCEKNTIFISQGDYPIKGLHLGLRIIYELKKEIPKMKLRIAGKNPLDNLNDPYSKYINNLIDDFSLSENVNFLGVLNANDMINEYLKCNVYVQTSIVENSPNSLGEAMYLGVPTIASNCGGTNQMIDHRFNGFLFDILKLEDAVSNIIEISKMKIAEIDIVSKNAINKGEELYSRLQNKVKLNYVYNQVIS